mgnify:CR=1 FL=1
MSVRRRQVEIQNYVGRENAKRGWSFQNRMKTSINCLYKEEKVVVAKIANTTDKEKQK